MAPFRKPHSLEFDAIANFRDLGGHTTSDGARVARGRLFRSGHLAHASEADVARLEDLGLRRVFDFRTLSDIEVEGHDRLPDMTDHVRLPMPDPAKDENLRQIIMETPAEALHGRFGEGRAHAMMERAAGNLVHERSEPYRQFLAELTRKDSLPGLFHCSAGKDRAGWAGSVVLLALGVPRDEVIEQYLLSNRAVEAIHRRIEIGEPSRSPDRGLRELMRPFMEVRVEYIQASFAAVDEVWGGFDRYLEEGLAFDQTQRERLRELLLE